MFGEEFHSVPIVQASIDGSLSPEGNWNLGKAIAKLRCVQRDHWYFIGCLPPPYRSLSILPAIVTKAS
jgi:hypothetical protein